MSKTVFKIENEAVLFQLFNKNKHNNTLNVICDFCEEIGAPFYDNSNNIWVVPSDITGLNAKKSKCVKIRFHPSIEELSSKNREIHEIACKSSLKYLDCLLEDSLWTRRGDQDNKLFESQLDKFTDILMETDKIVEFQNNTLTVVFLQNENFEELIKIAGCNSVKSHLVTEISNDENGQIAKISFEKDDFKRDLLKLYIDSDYLQTSQTECHFETSPTCLSWILKRQDKTPRDVPQKITQRLECSIFVNNVEMEMPIYSPCSSILNLSSKLSIAIGVQPVSPNPNNIQQSLIKVPNSLTNDVIIGLDKTEASHLTKYVAAITTTPLMVNCDFLANSSSTDQTQLAWSPTDSIDSGVSLSPTHSIDEPFYTPTGRERSISECGMRLRGILKWPATGPYSTGHGRLFNRSYSECIPGDGSISPNYFGGSQPFFEDEEDLFHEDGEDCEVVAAPRKKSVSFSERIEKRLFNSNSSIEAQKRKNQKKNEKKKKREERCASIDDDEMMIPAQRITQRHQTV
ncbi:unnamed protein product [Caenorhabditis angaria]|uniref:Uncharacterized protein n=1 Tax=Caenorhabditis angaria TaxID=860376 RepID=A0A9P1IU89_9PELO|nr:unnamed protein product [Caenorhabditis angaria]